MDIGIFEKASEDIVCINKKILKINDNIAILEGVNSVRFHSSNNMAIDFKDVELLRDEEKEISSILVATCAPILAELNRKKDALEREFKRIIKYYTDTVNAGLHCEKAEDDSYFEDSIAGIQYWYRRDDGEPILEGTREELIDSARDRIAEMIADGCDCGELCTTLNDKDDNYVDYRGRWGGK